MPNKKLNFVRKYNNIGIYLHDKANSSENRQICKRYLTS